jgi:hypothetical protein
LFPSSSSFQAGLNLQQTPHDVRLSFPAAGKNGTCADLWVKSDILRRSSPYFKSLLDSDFAESVPRRSKRARKSSMAEVEAPLAPETAEGDFEDSDDETDDFLFSKHPPPPDPSPNADELSYHQVTVTQTAFSTYRSLLLYFSTGFVHFAPLSSSFDFRPESRIDFLSSTYNKDPSLPLPNSPKSLYRLAHLLDLDDLQKRSLKAVKSSLSVENAAIELFSDASVAYDELRAVILAFVKEKWAEVKETDGWTEYKDQVKSGEMPEGAPVVMDVLEALNDA